MMMIVLAVICAGMCPGVQADVPEEVRSVSQRLGHIRSMWANSIDDAYVAGTNLLGDVRVMTNDAWRGTCLSNILDVLVALPHVSYAKDMIAYTNRQACGEKDIQAMENQFHMLGLGRYWFKNIAPDYFYDSAFTLVEIWRREADLQRKAYEKIAITNDWQEYHKNASIAYFTNEYNRTQWKKFYERLNEEYAANSARASHVHRLSYHVDQEARDFFDGRMILYYRSAPPERRLYIRKRLVELLGSEPSWIKDEEDRQFQQRQKRECDRRTGGK